MNLLNINPKPIFSNSCLSVQWNGMSFFVRFISGFAILEKLCINYLQYPTSPKNDFMWVAVFGILKSSTAWIFLGLDFTPSFVITCFIYTKSGFKNSHLSGYIFNPKFRNLSNTIARFRLCSWMVLSNIMTSSRYTKQLFPTNPRCAFESEGHAIIVEVTLWSWKCSIFFRFLFHGYLMKLWQEV